MATSTVASPPNATKPMTPTLNSPAKPHCRFTPSAMTAETSAMLRMPSAVFQDPEKIQTSVVASSRNSAATKAKSSGARIDWVMRIFP